MWPLPTVDQATTHLILTTRASSSSSTTGRSTAPCGHKASHLVADGYFGTFAGKGHWSFKPPEGLSDLIDCRSADFDVVADFDVQAGKNIVQMECGTFALPAGTTYSILEAQGATAPIATIGDEVVGVRSAAGRFTWYGFALSATASSQVPGQPGSPAPVGLVHDEVAIALLATAGVEPWFALTGDRIVAFRRHFRQGGSLIFALNLERRTARTRVQPRWPIKSARDLLGERDLALCDGAFELTLAFGEVAVIHCADR